jgi:pimeloyl-ACP methyl ester carboxylesterase
VLFLHGNRTWSFLWRRVLPGLTGSARCVAVDLIGMGRSGKPAIGYRFADHAAYLEAFADQLGLRDVTVVGHDWGAVLGLDLLRRRPDVVGRIAVCEGHLHPFARWEDIRWPGRDAQSRLCRGSGPRCRARFQMGRRGGWEGKMMSWSWMNIPLMVLSVCCRAGIPLWHVLTRWDAEGKAKHADAGARAVPAPAWVQPAPAGCLRQGVARRSGTWARRLIVPARQPGAGP